MLFLTLQKYTNVQFFTHINYQLLQFIYQAREFFLTDWPLHFCCQTYFLLTCRTQQLFQNDAFRRKHKVNIGLFVFGNTWLLYKLVLCKSPGICYIMLKKWIKNLCSTKSYSRLVTSNVYETPCSLTMSWHCVMWKLVSCSILIGWRCFCGENYNYQCSDLHVDWYIVSRRCALRVKCTLNFL